MNMEINPKEEYSLNEALKLTEIKSYQTLRRYVDKGELKAKEMKRGYKVLGSDLMAFIKKLEKEN